MIASCNIQVLTGVLDLPLVPMLVGSLPIFVCIVGMTAAGAMMLKTAEPAYASLGGFVSVGARTALLSGAMLPL